MKEKSLKKGKKCSKVVLVTFLGGTLYIYIIVVYTHTPKGEKIKGHVHFTITITRDKNGPLYNVIVFSFIIYYLLFIL